MSVRNSLRPLALALVGLGMCSSLYAGVTVYPASVPVGKGAELLVTLDDPTGVTSVSLQPAMPYKGEEIPLDRLKKEEPGLILADERGKPIARFGDHPNGIEAGRLTFRAAGEAGLEIDKRRFWGKPNLLAAYRTTHPALDIALSGRLALLATEGGLTVIDVENPVAPLWLGSHQKLGRTIKVSAEGDRAAVLSDADIVFLVDLSNPKEPTSLGAYRSKQSLSDLDLVGDQVYALGDQTIEVIDFSIVPPQISNEGLDFGQGVNLGGERRVYIENGLAYVADWFSGIHIYDITRPRQPELLSSFHTPGSPKGILVRDGVAFVPDDDHGLAIIDVADPLNPKPISTLPTAGLGYTPRLVGDLLYLASHRGGFQIIDVSDVAHPKQLGEFDTEGKAWSMEVRDNIAYIADDDQGLQVFDVSDPAQPKPIGQYRTGAAAEEVMIRNNLAYVAFYDDGLHILDIADPRHPQLVSRLSLPGHARGLDLVGDRLYVAGWLAGVHVVDVADPKAPKLLGSHDTRGATWGVKAKGQYLFAMDWWGGITVLDISDPTRPTAAGGYHNRGQVKDIATRDNYAFVAHGSNGVQVYDIKNALHPTWTTGIGFPGQAQAVTLQDDRAYVAAGDGGLAVVDIGNPFNIRWLGSYDGRGEITTVAVKGQHAYVGDSREGLVTLDLSTTPPRKSAALPLKANDLWLDGERLYLATDQGWAVAGIAQNGILKLKEQHTLEGGARYLIGSHDHLFIADRDRIRFLQQGDEIRQTGELTLEETITDLDLADGKLIAGTRFALYHIDPISRTINARYPLLAESSNLSYHQGVVYISGEETIAAVRLPPELTVPVEGEQQVDLALPADMSEGGYDLRIRYNDGREALLRNAVRIEMPKFSKPKMTMEQFKKLMEMQKGSDIFTQPAPAEQ